MNKPTITGLQKLTLLDYPDKMAAILFLPGCNMDCPFCHNSELIHGPQQSLDYNEVLTFLQHRKRMLDGVVITGGEPSLQDLQPLLIDLKNMEYSIKIDTNGLRPEAIQTWLKQNLVDYIAMDIKCPPQSYHTMTHQRIPDIIDRIDESINTLRTANIPHEFRTTVTPSLLTPDDFQKIGEWIGNTETIFIQPFVKRDTVPDQSLIEPNDAFLIACLQAIQPHVKHAEIRGRDIHLDDFTN